MRPNLCLGRCLRALPFAAVLAGCGAELREDANPPWDPHAWRERVRAHAERVETLLPLLAEVRAAADPARYRDTLRAVYHRLRAAEDSIPPAATWKADLPDAEIASKYGEAVRDLRYGAEVMLDGIERENETGQEEARRYLALGLDHFREVRIRLGSASGDPRGDTMALHLRSSFAPGTYPGQSWEHGLRPAASGLVVPRVRVRHNRGT